MFVMPFKHTLMCHTTNSTSSNDLIFSRNTIAAGFLTIRTDMEHCLCGNEEGKTMGNKASFWFRWKQQRDIFQYLVLTQCSPLTSFKCSRFQRCHRQPPSSFLLTNKRASYFLDLTCNSQNIQAKNSLCHILALSFPPHTLVSFVLKMKKNTLE